MTRCHRCKKEIATVSEMAEQLFVVRSGQAMTCRRFETYHEKCYPPVLFHRRQWQRDYERDRNAMRRLVHAYTVAVTHTLTGS
jgi:hypothetical protein